MNRCRWCDENIEFNETYSFWVHVDTGRTRCPGYDPAIYYATPPKWLEKRHHFKIVGKYRDPIPFHTAHADDGYAYFVVYRCRDCGSVWKVERSWPWVGKMAFDPKDWSVCQGPTE